MRDSSSMNKIETLGKWNTALQAKWPTSISNSEKFRKVTCRLPNGIETQNDFKNLLLAVYPYTGLPFLPGEPMWWDSLVETLGQMPGSQTWLCHYLQVYYLPFCPYLLPQKLNHYQLYFPHTVVQKAKQENGCELPLEKCIIHNVCKCKWLLFLLNH